MKYLIILLAIVACNNAPSPAEASAKAGLPTEASAKAGLPTGALANEGSSTDSLAVVSTEAGSSTTVTSIPPTDSIVPPQYINGKMVKVEKSEDAWKRELPEDAFRVLRKEGTERSFTGKYWDNHEHGIYVCAGCGLPLFSSETKFESGTGWPSFYKPFSADCIADKTDNSYGMDREEVECARCGGHQGHVFPDGPAPTGLRYCINSVSLKFVKQ